MKSALPLVFCCLLFTCRASAAAQSLPAPKAAAVEEVSRLEPEIRRMAHALWEFSETALREDRSAALLSDVLEREGFSLERGVAGMPTAFVASFGQGRPIIGILAEYDALPGVGNAPVPGRQERRDGVTTGHGCGHNLFGAGSVAAAIAVKRAMEAQGLPGTVRLYGCPAEETLVGKVYMARDGLFDDLDACVDWHPGLDTRVGNTSSRAMNSFQVEFQGQAAHGSSDPWNGRSALDAVELMNHAVNMMREHVRPTARTHYVISSGGEVPNVVPEYAKVWYFTREIDRAALEPNYRWILQIAEAAALATQTRHNVHLITGVHNYNLNRPLQEQAQRNLEWVGAPQWTEEEQAFARTLQQSLGIEETGYDAQVHPLSDSPDPVSGGSTDVAEVSWIAPTVSVRVASAAAGVPWHSWATTACHGAEWAPKSAVVAAKVMALTAIDLFSDPDLRQRAKEDFLQKTGGRAYQSPIPSDQPPPLP